MTLLEWRCSEVVVVPGSFAIAALVSEEASPTLCEEEGVVKVVGH
jgi:hypothetical protein